MTFEETAEEYSFEGKQPWEVARYFWDAALASHPSADSGWLQNRVPATGANERHDRGQRR